MRQKTKTNLNYFLIDQKKREGIEVKEFRGARPNERGACNINPLDRLLYNETLSREEYDIAKIYHDQYWESMKDHHARPSLVYQGLSHSSASTKHNEGGPDDIQLKASAYILKVHSAINYWESVVKLEFPEITRMIFQKHKTIDEVKKALQLDHRTVHARIKKICKIMLDMSKPTN